MTSPTPPTATSSGASPLLAEAAKLLEALQSWAVGAAGHDLPIASDSPECRVCPFCQALRALKGVRPEVVDHLAGASTELAAALRAALDAPAAAGSGRTVEKITVTD